MSESLSSAFAKVWRAWEVTRCDRCSNRRRGRWHYNRHSSCLRTYCVKTVNEEIIIISDTHRWAIFFKKFEIQKHSPILILPTNSMLGHTNDVIDSSFNSTAVANEKCMFYPHYNKEIVIESLNYSEISYSRGVPLLTRLIIPGYSKYEKLARGNFCWIHYLGQ